MKWRWASIFIDKHPSSGLNTQQYLRILLDRSLPPDMKYDNINKKGLPERLQDFF
jgi:hypothetical protein